MRAVQLRAPRVPPRTQVLPGQRPHAWRQRAFSSKQAGAMLG